MNLRNPYGVLHSFSIKNIFYDKVDERLFEDIENGRYRKTIYIQA